MIVIAFACLSWAEAERRRVDVSEIRVSFSLLGMRSVNVQVSAVAN